MANLFEAAGLKGAPRPLVVAAAESLADAGGQDHIVGWMGTLTVMPEQWPRTEPQFLGPARLRQTIARSGR